VNVGWIWTSNLRPFLEVVALEIGYSFDDSDWLAFAVGLAGTDSERGPWFEYPVGPLTVLVAYEPGADEMVTVIVEGADAENSMKFRWASKLMRLYELQGCPRAT